MILFVHDLSAGGGAELSTRYLLSIAPFPVKLCVGIAGWQEASGIVLSGIEFLHRSTAVAILNKLWVAKTPYVTWGHHTGLGNLRLADWTKMYQLARLNVFVSPQHFFWRHKYFADGIDPVPKLTVPVGMDPDVFYPMEVERQGHAVCMMTRMDSKKHRVWEYAEKHPYLQILVYSIVNDPGLPNVSLMPTQPRESLPGIYSAAAMHIDLPGRPMAGGNATYEAILCGCEPVTNEFVGVTSWPWNWWEPELLREMIRDGNHQFWQAIGNALGV